MAIGKHMMYVRVVASLVPSTTYWPKSFFGPARTADSFGADNYSVPTIVGVFWGRTSVKDAYAAYSAELDRLLAEFAGQPEEGARRAVAIYTFAVRRETPEAVVRERARKVALRRCRLGKSSYVNSRGERKLLKGIGNRKGADRYSRLGSDYWTGLFMADGWRAKYENGKITHSYGVQLY